VNAAINPLALEQLRLALHAYDHAVFGQLNATADALRHAARAAGYVYGSGLPGPVVWSRQTVAAQLRAEGDAPQMSDGELQDILGSLHAKGLVGVDADGEPILTELGQAALHQQPTLFAEGEPAE
jgi:hypothetical protein